MKVYIHPIAPPLMRVNIKKTGFNTEHITLCETSQECVLTLLKSKVNDMITTEVGKHKVVIEVRECIKSKNGTSRSITFNGREPKEIKEILLKTINEDLYSN